MEELIEDRLKEIDHTAGVNSSDALDVSDEEGEEGEEGAEAENEVRQQEEAEERRPESDADPEKSATNGKEEWVDILGNGDIQKKVIKPGTQPRPNRGQKVTICYTGMYGTEQFERKEDYSFLLGEGEALQAFELALPLMEVGEVALVKASPRFAYGDQGLPSVPGGAFVEYEIELLAAETLPELDKMSLPDKIGIAERKKSVGNDYFKIGQYEYAYNLYKRAVEICESDFADADKYPQEVKTLLKIRIDSLNNLAYSYLKLDKCDLAIQSCDKVLTLDSENVKALYRKGMSLGAIQEYYEAIQVLGKLLKIEPNNAAGKAELSRLQAARANREKKEKAIYGSMLKGVERDDPPKTQQPNNSGSGADKNTNKEKEKKKENKGEDGKENNSVFAYLSSFLSYILNRIPKPALWAFIVAFVALLIFRLFSTPTQNSDQV